MEEIDIKELLTVFWKRKILILIVTVVFALAGLVYCSISKTPIYEASTTLILTPERSKDSEAFTSYYHINNNNETIDIEGTYPEIFCLTNEIEANATILTSSSVIAKSQKVASETLKNLKLDIPVSQLLSTITVTPEEETQSLTIAVTHSNAEMACTLANEVSKVFTKEAEKAYNTNNFYILDEAVVPQAPINGNALLKNIAIFAFVGAVLIIGCISTIYLFDKSVKSEQDIEKITKLSNITTISEIKNLNSKIISDLKLPESNMFRTLRTYIQSKIENTNNKVVLITSPDSNSGKSFIVGNLAYTFAKINKKVLILDANMMNGTQHKLFNMDNKVGLSDFLLNKKGDIRDYINETETENLYLLSSGECKMNSSDLLASQKMKDTIELLRKSFDIIIIDTQECLNSSDSLILTKLSDLTLFVVTKNKSKIEDIEKAKSAIENNNSEVTGIILNEYIQKTKKF